MINSKALWSFTKIGGLLIGTTLAISGCSGGDDPSLNPIEKLSANSPGLSQIMTGSPDAYPVVWAIGSYYTNPREHYGIQRVIAKFIRNRGGTGPDATLDIYPLSSDCGGKVLAIDSNGGFFGGLFHFYSTNTTFIGRYENPETAVGPVGCYSEPAPNPPIFSQIGSSAGFVFDTASVEHFVMLDPLGMKYTPSLNITVNFEGTATDGDIVGASPGQYYALKGKKIIELDENFNIVTTFPEPAPLPAGVATYGLASAWGGEELYVFAYDGSVWMFRRTPQAWTNMIPANDIFWVDAASPPNQ